jgi:hypothetical protein
MLTIETQKIKLTVRPDLMFVRKYDSSVWELTTSDDKTNYAETREVVENNGVCYRISAGNYKHVEQNNGKEYDVMINGTYIFPITTEHQKKTVYIPHSAI